MPESNAVELTSIEIEYVLAHIYETLLVYEYPTPPIFSSLTRLGIVSFLRGKGVEKDIESIAITVFKQLSEFSNQNKNYNWFVEWSRKLVELVKEKKAEEI